MGARNPWSFFQGLPQLGKNPPAAEQEKGVWGKPTSRQQPAQPNPH